MGSLVTNAVASRNRVFFAALLVICAYAPPALRAQSTYLVADLTATGADSSPRDLTAVDGTLFFVASDDFGFQLWKSDGTAVGTARLTNFPSGSSIGNLTSSGTRLVFTVATGGNIAIWGSDGTIAGTIQLEAFSQVRSLTAVNNTVFFVAQEPGQGDELWITDGTAAGSEQVKDVMPGFPDYANLVAFNGMLFFTLGDELWKSDGTGVGTVSIVDINPSGTVTPGQLTAVNGTLFFTVGFFAPLHGELWKSNGTAAGTVPVIDLNPGGNTLYGSLTNVDGLLYVFAAPTPGTVGLWTSNGTAAGTVQIATYSIFPFGATAVGSSLFFVISSGADQGLWTSDGSPGGTLRLSTLTIDPEAGLAGDLTDVNGTLFFAAYDATAGRELWKSDGSALGTGRVTDIFPGSNGSRPSSLEVMSGTLYFAAADPTAGAELWTSNGSAAGTTLVADIAPGTGDSFPTQLTDVAGTLFFSFSELWKSNGTEAGTTQVADILGPDLALPANLTELNGMLFFHPSTLVSENQLWKSDGTASGTVPVTTVSGGGIGRTINIGSTLFFNVGNNGIWRSDGTAGGTELLWEMEGPEICVPMGCFNLFSNPVLFDLEGTLYFTALDGLVPTATSAAIWKSGGTAATTVRVADEVIPFDPMFQPIGSPASVNGTLFFPSLDPGGSGSSDDVELWKIDAGMSTPTLVADINVGANGSYPASLTKSGAFVFFSATEPGSGRELWRSDGTTIGTLRLADINSGSAGSDPAELRDVGGTLYFSAVESGAGRELWKSDGTPGGTVRVADINPGTDSSDPGELTQLNGTIYFSAAEPSGGRELWQTDGTPSGTEMVADVLPGTAGSMPTNLTVSGGRLFFTAFGPLTGHELWAHVPCSADADDDGLCDEIDPCVNLVAVTVQNTRLKLRRINPPPGDDVLLLDGDLTVPVTPAIDPITKGVRVILAGAGGTVLDASIPGGAYDSATKSGWRLHGSNWLYRNRNGIAGITKVRIAADPTAPGSLRVKVRGKHGTYPVSPASLPLTATIVIDTPAAMSGQCGEVLFAPMACTFTSNGNGLQCD